MDLDRLNQRRTVIAAVASLLLIASLLFFNWYSLDHNPQRGGVETSSAAFVCGDGNYSCTGFSTFPILRWLLLLAAIAPLILGYIIVRGHKLSYPPGEITMVAGMAATVLIGYNGLLDKPGSGPAEIGISLDYGYWIALVAALVIAVVGYLRSLDSGARQGRKAPGTV